MAFVRIDMRKAIEKFNEGIRELQILETKLNDEIEKQSDLKKTDKEKISSLEKTLSTTQEETEKLKTALTEQLNINSRIQTQLAEVMEDLKNTKETTILITSRQGKGRKPITDEQIRIIKESLNKGLSMRKAAELADVSLGSAYNYSKPEEEKTESMESVHKSQNEHFSSIDECIEKGQFCNGDIIGGYAFFDLEKAVCKAKNFQNDGNLFARTSEKNHKLAVGEVNKRIMESGKSAKECIEDMIKDVEKGKLWK